MIIALAALLATAAAGYFFWLRDSSLVAVNEVKVRGVQSGDRDRIVSELTRSAEGMTTLHVDAERLEAAVAPFPTVASVQADADFPHGLTVEVSERPPALIAAGGGGETAVAGDGTVLPGVEAEEGLPRLELDQVPTRGVLTGEALEQALAVGAAPEQLRPLIEGVDISRELGVEVKMRGGIELRFGSGSRAEEKWNAAAAVLADPKLEAVSYVDVRIPERPAAGAA